MQVADIPKIATSCELIHFMLVLANVTVCFIMYFRQKPKENVMPPTGSAEKRLTKSLVHSYKRMGIEGIYIFI